MRKLRPVHPGEILREEFLAPLGLSMAKLALALRVPTTRVAEIVHERRGVRPETALGLSCYFGTSPEFWMSLQTNFDLESFEDKRLKRIRRDVLPFAEKRGPGV